MTVSDHPSLHAQAQLTLFLIKTLVTRIAIGVGRTLPEASHRG